MRSFARLAVCAATLFALTLALPARGQAACSSGGVVSNVNDCVAAGNKATDCFLEWSISPVPATDPKTGQPTAKINCLDNDPACDADNTPGQCTFMVGACLNVTDGRFACTATDTQTYVLKKPSAKDGTKPHKDPFARSNRRGLDLGLDALVPTGTPGVCADETPFVVTLKKNGTKKNKLQIQAIATDATFVKDKDVIKFTCLPNPAVATQAIASARQITSTSELIGGPLAMGRIGDWLIENDKVRFIIRDVGRDFSFMLTYGGHIMDADLQRTSGPGRDNFLAFSPLINISSTDNPTSISVVNDGSAGGPGILQTSGPDDLFDPIDPRVAIKGFSTSLSVPPSAIDNNLPVNIVNEYTLNPGENFVQIETIIENTGGTALDLYIGDFTTAGGQFEFMVPGLGFGDASIRIGGNQDFGEQTYDMLAWLGFGDAAGMTYGLIPEIYNLTSSFGQSSVFVPVYGQNLVSVLLAPDGNKPPGALNVPAGGYNSFKRWFVVTDNAIAGVLDARNQLVARGDIVATQKTGWIQGTVTVNGQPIDGARVAITKEPGARGAQAALVDVFETKDGGFYQGTLPRGIYKAQVKVPGHQYEGGTIIPLKKDVKIGGGTRVVDFVDVPAAGYVQVFTKESGLPISAKVSVVGTDPAPDPNIVENASLAFVTGQLFGYDAHEKEVIYGLPQVHFTPPTTGDTGVFALPPGDYYIVVSHGPEYSISKTPLTVTAGSPGSPQVVNASVVRVVNTDGYISSDHHVHMINSTDSTVSKQERILTMLAEGMDHFVASDHDYLTTDLSGEVAALGATGLVKTTISDEITTFDSGHFGAYPLDPVAGSVTNGAIDWGRAGEPAGAGYPSDGSYDLSVQEMGLLVKGPPYNGIVFQANHFNSGTLGFFRVSGIDTTVAPPQSSTLPANLRQDPLLTNLYSDELTALEIWIESSRSQNALTLGENLGDWFNMLNNFDSTNPLLRKAAVCDSDTHSTTIVQAGGPRTMIASTTDDPALLDSVTLATDLNAGRAVCTSGPFMRVAVVGDFGDEAKHDIGDSQLVEATLGSATINVDIQSPTWAEFDLVEIFVNNAPSCTTTSPNFVGGVKKVCPPVANFSIPVSPSTVAGEEGDFRLEASVSQPITVIQDSWVVVVVRGRDGISAPLFPMNPQSMLKKSCAGDPCKACASNSQCGAFGPCSIDNSTAALLANDGTQNRGQCGVTALALSNPLFIDWEGDGLYKGVAIP